MTPKTGVETPAPGSATEAASRQAELAPGLEAVVVGERLGTDGRAGADAVLRPPDLHEKIGDAVGNQMRLVIIGRADHEVERAQDEGHAVEIAQGLFHARKHIDRRDAREELY